VQGAYSARCVLFHAVYSKILLGGILVVSWWFPGGFLVVPLVVLYAEYSVISMYSVIF